MLPQQRQTRCLTVKRPGSRTSRPEPESGPKYEPRSLGVTVTHPEVDLRCLLDEEAGPGSRQLASSEQGIAEARLKTRSRRWRHSRRTEPRTGGGGHSVPAQSHSPHSPTVHTAPDTHLLACVPHHPPAPDSTLGSCQPPGLSEHRGTQCTVHGTGRTVRSNRSQLPGGPLPKEIQAQ